MNLKAQRVKLYASVPRKARLYFPNCNGIERTVETTCCIDLVSGDQFFELNILDACLGDPEPPEGYHIDGPIRLLGAWRACSILGHLPQLNSLYWAGAIMLGYSTATDKRVSKEIAKHVGMDRYCALMRQLPPRFTEYVEYFTKTPARIDVDEIMHEVMRQRIPTSTEVAYAAMYYESEWKSQQKRRYTS